MEVFIFIIGFFLVLLIPTAFIATACITYINGTKLSEVILKSFLALVIYVCVTVAFIPLMFAIVFAGAHSEPVGNALNLKGEIFYSFLVLAYAVSGWLLCSLIYGKWIKPRLIFGFNREKTPSILETK